MNPELQALSPKPQPPKPYPVSSPPNLKSDILNLEQPPYAAYDKMVGESH